MTERVVASDVVQVSNGSLLVEVQPDAGGRLHRIRYRDVDVLVAPEDTGAGSGDPWAGPGFFMAPWCNRVPDGRLVFAGRRQTLEPNFPDGSAIHGVVYRRRWERPSRVGRDALSWGVTVGDGPWIFRLEARLTLDPDRLRLDLRLLNLSAEPIPGGLGWHPWFTAARPLRVEIPYATRFRLDDANRIADDPDDRDRVAVFDSAHGEVWGRHELLTTRGPLRLAWTDPDLTAGLRLSGTFDHVLVYAAGPQQGIAVEPQNHAIGGFDRADRRLPGGIPSVDPGESVRGSIEMEFSHA
jgi:galactose mutarotase-like enzyme